MLNLARFTVNRMLLFTGLIVAAIGLGTTSTHAQIGDFGAPTPPVAEDLVTFELGTDTFRVKPGQEFHLIARFTIESPWHLYWKNPGAGAAAPDITLTLPPALEQTGRMIWPRPKLMKSSTGDQYVYEKDVAIYIPVRASSDWNMGRSMMVSAEAFFAVCDDKRCLMGSSTELINIERDTNSRLGPKGFPEAEVKRLEREKAKLPYIIGSDAKQDTKTGIFAMFDEKLVAVRIPRRGLEDPESVVFFPGYTGGVMAELESVDLEDTHFMVRIRMNVNRNNIVDESPVVYGLIGLGAAAKDPCYEFLLPLSDSKE